MTTNDILPNGLLASSSARKHKKPFPSPKKRPFTASQSFSRQQATTAPTGSVLTPVSSNFFYQHDETLKRTTLSSRPRVLIGSREANEWKKRKATEQDVGVPWMFSKPMNSGKGFMGSGGALQESQHDSKRIKLAPVDDNPSQTHRGAYISSPKQEFSVPNTLGNEKRNEKKQIPLFMPSPSPKKLVSSASQPEVSDKQAKQLLDDLLEGLDTDVGFFDDDLDSKSVDEANQLGEDGIGIESSSSDSSLSLKKDDIKPEQQIDFEMCDWMKVGQSTVKDEAAVLHSDSAENGVKPMAVATVDVKPQLTPEVKSDLGKDTDSEYADEFDYDKINLDDLDLAANNDGSGATTPTVGPVSTYPILNPPIHDPLKAINAAYDPLPWRRCIVESVSSEDDTNHRFGQSEKVVQCRVVESFAAHGCEDGKGEQGVQVGTMLECRLMGEWADLVLASSDIVNIISPELAKVRPRMEPLSTSSNPATIGLSFSYQTPSNYLITHPDILFPMTSLAGAVGCRRKPLVMDLVKGGGGNASSKPLLYGNILHELLQETFQTRRFSAQDMKSCLDTLLRKPGYQLDIWSCDLGVEEVRAEVWEKALQSLVTFGNKWVGEKPNEMATLHNSLAKLAITGLHDIEEAIWSPKWGMKGKIDASVQATIRRPDKKAKPGCPSFEADSQCQSGPMPFEIKTGRAVGVMEHRAQTMLYTLLMEERYRTPIQSGLLYYTQTDSVLEVPAATGEIRSLLMARNELAGYASRKRVRQERDKLERGSSTYTQECKPLVTLPPNDTKQSECGPVELEADVDDEFAHLDDVLPDLHVVDALGTSEAKLQATGISLTRDMEELPILPPTIDNERECARCYASDACMLYRRAIDGVEPHDNDPIADIFGRKTSHLTPEDLSFFSHWEELVSIEEQDIIRFKNQLWTMTAKQREKSGRCFANMKIVKHENEAGLVLTKIHKHIYTFVRATENDGVQSSQPSTSFLSGHIGKNDPISLSIEPEFLAIGRGFVLDLTPTEVTIGTNLEINIDALLDRSGRDRSTPIVWRVDKDEMLAGTAKMRNNLAQLFFAEEVGGDHRRRDLIVHLQPPRFEEVYAPDEQEIPEHLNPDQRLAMRKVLTAKDYALILGMPGTGKTTTIAEIILALVKRGKCVLLTSYTHSAVDTILMKLVNSDHRILRLGNADRVSDIWSCSKSFVKAPREQIHPDVRHLSLDALGGVDSLSQLEDRLMGPQIVATTCLSIDHPVLSRRKFDYCIVDEASQITLPSCIGPLRFADSFVLVGDHFQLPPIVKNAEARRGGLDVSLFKLLCDSHPEAVVDLSYQYRMNADVMSLSNTLIYNNRLKCGSDTIANQTLEIPEKLGAHKCNESCWISQTLLPNVKTVFLNTDQMPAKEARAGDLVYNQVEANLVFQLTSELVACGIKEEQIGVITPYRQQIKMLSAMLQDMKGIEVMTSDKSQGRDKDCIVISMVRSNDLGSIGDLLRDWRRINVSFTRAKKKLIIIGSKSTLSADDRLLSDFFALVKERDWIADLPQDAVSMHSEAFVSPVNTLLKCKAKEERSPRTSKSAKLSQSLVDSKPFIRDILNVSLSVNDFFHDESFKI
ncbi:hypothetical protein QFC22_005896 [Naganishia vaughanmartiniae]|uniref:Uncharacterized protein n=1 Tax=Naganishia vaughanmartiniae TaxID=1424756 RepID=A0ACC2WSJ1_9TREE|nr:hypothetical protein QFC22_005896 [Naganishia vaughanmartiniae]